MGTTKYGTFIFVAEKPCGKCKVVLPREFFQKDSYAKTGLQSKCRACTALATAEFSKRRPSYFKEKCLERYHSQDTELYNKQRYSLYRDRYLERRKQYSESVKGRLNGLLGSARLRANKANKPFDLDIDWLLDRYDEQDGKCILTDIVLEFKTEAQHGRSYYPFSPSLDKIDSNGSYTKDNTRLVCTLINLAMNKFGEDTFEKLAIAFLNKRNSNKNE